MKDQFGREINYLRISVTDRCNLRCVYCMPEEGVEMLSHEDILSFEEIVTVCEQAVRLGITKIRITGGEPLIRLGITKLVEMIHHIPGIQEINMTTNGVLLRKHISELAAAGLHGVNISLDTTDEKEFERITRRSCFEEVMEGIDSAIEAGLCVKINSVLMDHENYKRMILMAKDRPVDVRFIELMPIGSGRNIAGPSNEEVFRFLKEEYPDIEKDMRVHGNGPAVYYKIPGFLGSIGFISPIHGVFCDHCNRIRLTATGCIKPCLCYGECFDLRPLLRTGDIEAVYKVLEKGIQSKPGAHCFDRPEDVSEEKRMVSIGG